MTDSEAVQRTMENLAKMALKMSKNSKEATISDLRDVNQILVKVREQESKVEYEHVGEKGFDDSRDWRCFAKIR